MKKTIRDIDVAGKVVLIRVDFNVPIKDGNILDDTRIREALPTIAYLLGKGAKLVLMSHLGRPKGRDMQYSMAPVSKRLQELINVEVIQADDVAGSDTVAKLKSLDHGILMLENLRFDEGEETNDEALVSRLASLADIYVNDAFGTAHRAHASTYGVATKLPNAIGLLMEKELDSIGYVMHHAKRPFTAILGGAKVSDKLKVIYSLLERCDNILIGGAMAYTFQKALGYEMANSLVEDEMISDAKNILQAAVNKKVNIYLPYDHVVADSMDSPKVIKNTKNANIDRGFIGLDIGKKTIKQYKRIIKGSRTILWNGPMGYFENENFANGTRRLAKAVAHSKAYSLVGGGDSVNAIESFHLSKKISHISTGGGASLKMFEGKELPAISVIEDK